MMSEAKPIHVKPSVYAYWFQPLKEIALSYGYNLVLHGSLNRDFDLIAIPWQQDLKPYEDMLKEFCEYLGGELLQLRESNDDDSGFFTKMYHGRMQYVIDINRGGYLPGGVFMEDPQWYLDISIMPTLTSDSKN